MKLFQKVCSGMTAAAMGISMSAALAAGMATVSAADMTAIQLVEDMGAGWNLGNSLDCTNTWTNPLTPSAIETAWGNSVTTENMIKEVKKSGFNTIRVPVTWLQMIDSSNNINADFMARVKEIVDYCINNDLYVIINIHHDGSDNITGNWLNVGAEAKDKFVAVWTQIAAEFKDYDEHLVFESMNEVPADNSEIAILNQAFVDTVRASGGNNADRLLLIPASGNNTDKLLDASFVLPDDDMIAVSCHYYEPPTFCVAPINSSWGYDADWGTADDRTKLENHFNQLKTKFLDNGVPVIIGEYGVLTEDKNGKDKQSIYDFLSAVANTAYNMEGMCSVLWDASDGGDMQFFSRESLSWFDSNVQAIYADLGDSGNSNLNKTDRVTFQAADILQADGTLLMDMKPYKELGLSVSSVVINYDISSSDRSAYGVGGAVSFNIVDADGAIHWSSLPYSMVSGGNVMTVEFTDELTASDDAGNTYTGTLDMDYLKVEDWYTWTDPEAGTVDFEYGDVTVIFDNYFYTEIGDSGTGTTTTTTTTATQTTTTTTTTATTPSGDALGNAWICLSNGVAEYWGPEDSGNKLIASANNPVITGNGTYTASLTLDADGAASSILLLMLQTDMNIYQEDGEGNKLNDEMVITVDQILVDGTEVAYTGASDGAVGTDNAGVNYRLNIYNTWMTPQIKDIDAAITNTSTIEVTFTISGIKSAGGAESTTATTETTTTTTTVTTGGGSDKVAYGDVNVDGVVDLLDCIMLNKALAQIVTLSGQANANADVNASGGIDDSDATTLVQYVIMAIPSLPA